MIELAQYLYVTAFSPQIDTLMKAIKMVVLSLGQESKV